MLRSNNENGPSSPSSPGAGPRHSSEEEESVKSRRKLELERAATPFKNKTNTYTNTHTLLRTPERQAYGSLGRNRFGFSGFNDETTTTTSTSTTTAATAAAVSSIRNARVAATSGKTYSSGYSESTCALATPNKSVTKPPNPASYAPVSTSRHPATANATANATPRPAPFSRRFSVSAVQPPAVVDTAQVPHFDLKENPSFWMDHNVQVMIRVRPLNSVERNTHGFNRCIKQDSSQSITWIGQPETRFTFDHVACETVDQEMLFRMAGLPMVENCLSGYNSCMFAYGQTGSGKTYTMLGELEDVEFTPSRHCGMTPRIFEFLFARIRAEEESRSDEKLKYSCRCSFLEIYNEQVTDLLDPSSTNLLLREDVKNGVYVENLSEFEVHTVGDVLRLLIQGASNRKVAATNMNRESSRSHSVFTCVIESKWERDSTTNLRYARLNLVDLAGSERQKSSGAEGERLKEAANINKSLSTLGHVIMLLVDIAHGKPRHVPYRDSRLTFLLQDSLGGNSKTMIIANISPSICCAAETLNTLKFAQRAKLIQNNAVVNEDSSGDVSVLQHQILLLKEELSALKRQNPSRALAFDSFYTARGQDNTDMENRYENDQTFLGFDSKGSLQVSSKQLKSLESMLAGALRREQVAESAIKKHEAEIEQLNRLVRQREEDNRCTKMMLKFREDKIHRMESLMGDIKPVDAYLLDENAALSEEVQLLRTKVDRNPEVTRFAVENIRLLEQLRRFQDFYEDGERDLLLKEVSELRAQLISSLDKSNPLQNHAPMVQDAPHNGKENESIRFELTCTLNELAECQSKLKSSLETNAKLSREIEDLQAHLRNKESGRHDHFLNSNSMKEMQVHCLGSQLFNAADVNNRSKFRDLARHAEEIVNLELELDILKIILKEEMSARGEMEETVSSLTRDVQLADEREMSMRKQREAAIGDLIEAKSVIEALESQQLLSISEIEDLKNHNSHYLELLHQQQLQITSLTEQRYDQISTTSCVKHSEGENSTLQLQLKKMQASLDKAKQLNMWYQSDHASQISTEKEMDEVRQQAEAETAEVIVCLQEELSVLQQCVQENGPREKEAESKALIFEIKLKELQETSDAMSHENEALHQSLLEKNMEIKLLMEEWETLGCQIEDSLIEGHDALRIASDQLHSISLSDRRGWLSEQFGKMVRQISDKELVIEKLNLCLEEATTRANDMEHMLMSLRGAAMVMTESHQQECYEKEKEIQQLRAELTNQLCAKEEEIYMFAKKGCESKEIVEAEVLSLLAFLMEFQEKCESKILVLDDKLHNVEECAQEAKQSWHQTKESLELQLVEAKATTAHNTVETSCLLSRFEEAQDTMKEADMMINGLMIANESLKFQVEDLRNINITLTSERDNLINEVKGLQSANESSNEKCRDLEEQLEALELDVSQNTSLIEELRSLVAQVQGTAEEAFTSLTHESNYLKSQVHDAVKFIHSSFEEIWSQILMKDCALSVLHLCHMGMLLETVTSLNAENEFLHNGICESNTVICDLRERNMKSIEELEMCQILEGKLLADFKSSFDRIIKKECETRELNLKLDHFEEELLVLQHQEGQMLERSNFMSSELSSLMKEIGQSNSQMIASFSEQEEIFTVEWFAKEFELLVFASELKEQVDKNAAMQREQTDFQAALEHLMIEIVTFQITAELKGHILFEMEANDRCMLKRVEEAEYSEANVLSQLHALKSDHKILIDRLSMTDTDLDKMQNGMFLLQSSSHDLQNKLLMVERENESLQNELLELKSKNCILLKDIQEKVSELDSFTSIMDALKLENCRLQESISILESRIGFLEKDLEVKSTELNDFQSVQSVTAEALCSKSQELESHAFEVNAQQEENLVLRDEVRFLEQRNYDVLSSCSSKVAMCATSMETAELQSCTVLKQLEEKFMMVLDQMSEDSCQNMDIVSRFLKDLEFVDSIAKDLVTQNLSLQEELLRKDEVQNGLLFDLRLLQESVASSKDQKDKSEELAVRLETTESELAARLQELNEAVAYGQTLDSKVQRQGESISALEGDLEKANLCLSKLSDENLGLRSQVEDNMAARSDLEKVLSEKNCIIDNLENELLEMGNTLGHVNDLVDSLNSNLDEVNNEKDQLQKQLQIMEEKVETSRVLAEENEAVAAESQEVAESRRIYAEEKEEEVQLLERSVEELDSTISVLEDKVDVLKGEAEKQRLQREELELELQSLKAQMRNVENADADFKRHFDENSGNLQEALMRIQALEKNVKNKDTEISKYKAHIVELTLHAEAQACEYKHKFKELEAMVEQFKSEEASSHEKISSIDKSEKNAVKGRGSTSPFKAKGLGSPFKARGSGSPFKARGSGSPFKCIGLGFTNQLKSEKDEDFTAERLRIEELEALAASRQKEIFMLNSRLAAAESMTHDVIRDLLGVKLDMSSYVTLLDRQDVQKITEKTQLDSVESQDQEVNKLKKQLDEFKHERQGWLDEIEKKQNELFAAQSAIENYRERHQFLNSENELLKEEMKNHKKRATELEGELKKVSGQQNIQQRIHHHAKIKEENNVLKVQNEDLCHRLRRAESFLVRTKEELAHYRARNGRSPYIHFDEEQRLKNKVKETEQEKLQLAQTLLDLCTSILKAAGVTKPPSEVDLSAAEEALQKLASRVISLERELEDMKLKNKVANEKSRLTEFMPDNSPLSSSSGDNRQPPRRASQSPFFSTLDR